MIKKWHKIKLEKILTQVKRPVLVEQNKEYSILGAHCYAKGLYIKDKKIGIDIQADKLFEVKKNDFVYNRLFGWKGSFAVVSADNDECFVSNEFPAFLVNEKELEPKFLWLYFSRAVVWDEILNLSTGGTPISRNRLKEDKFLSMEIPLPPLPEQQQIVEKIEEMSEYIKDINKLNGEINAEISAIVSSKLFTFFNENISNTVPLFNICKEGSQQVNALEIPDEIYLSLEDIQAQSGIVLKKRTVQEGNILGTAVKFNQKHILYSKLRPYLNKVVVPDFSGIGTTEFVVLEPNTEVIERDYLAWYLRSPQVVDKLVFHSSGTKMPRTNLKQFRQLKIPILPKEEQNVLANTMKYLLNKINDTKLFHNRIDNSFNALFPSILDKAFKGEL